MTTETSETSASVTEFERCACYYGCDSRDEQPHQHADDPCPVHTDAPVLG